MLGPVMLRDVAVLDLDHYAMTTDTYGSVVERLVDAITDGYDVYPDYWEMFSIAYRDGGCSSDLISLLNVYFDE